MKVSGYLLVAAAAGLLTLAACQDKSRKPAGPGTAQGEVLPGSVSDAMLPLDTVRSHAPFAPGSEGGDPAAEKDAKAGESGGRAKPASAQRSERVPSADAAANTKQ